MLTIKTQLEFSLKVKESELAKAKEQIVTLKQQLDKNSA
jgi:hypothetical protein